MKHLNFGFVNANLARGKNKSSYESWEIESPSKDEALLFLDTISLEYRKKFNNALKVSKEQSGSAIGSREKDSARTYKEIVGAISKEISRIEKIR